MNRELPTIQSVKCVAGLHRETGATAERSWTTKLHDALTSSSTPAQRASALPSILCNAQVANKHRNKFHTKKYVGQYSSAFNSTSARSFPAQRRRSVKTLHLNDVQTTQTCRTYLWCVDIECGVRRHDCSAPQKQQDSFAARSPHQGAGCCPTQQQRRQQCPTACTAKQQCTVLLCAQ